MIEKEVREATRCLGCGKEKTKGLLICWHCFKYRKNPFKYFNGPFAKWLKNKTGLMARPVKSLKGKSELRL